MSAPKDCYSSLALAMRETCASATPSVTGSRTNTTLDCSQMNGTDWCEHSRVQKWSSPNLVPLGNLLQLLKEDQHIWQMQGACSLAQTAIKKRKERSKI